MAPTSTLRPSKDDAVLIVGAGVFGLGLALELKLRGYRQVTVLDRYLPPVPDGSSVDISRIIRTEYADPLYAAMANEALAGWRSEYRDFYHESGFVVLSNRQDHPYMAKTKDTLRAQNFRFDTFSDANAPIKKLYPTVPTNLKGMQAIHNPAAGWADAGASIRQLSRRCSQAGVGFVTGPSGTVKSLVKTSNGDRIIGVKVATGETHHATQVVLATGAWTNRLIDIGRVASAAGQPVGFVQLTREEADKLHGMPVMINMDTGVFVFPPTPDTNVLKLARHGFGYSTRMQVDDGEGRVVSSPKRDSDNASSGFLPEDAEQALREGFRHFLPTLGDKPWSQKRLCWYMVTPKGDFIVDRHPKVQGLFVAVGGSGHGFKFLPVLGKYIADCFEGKASAALRQQWRLSRDAAGGELVMAGDGSPGGPPLRSLAPHEQAKL